MNNKTLRKIYYNAKIYTAAGNTPWAEAVVTAGNKIIYTGSNKGALEYEDKFTEKTDLNGKLMLPGLIDSHAHIIMGGQYLLGVDLTKAASKEEFRNKIAEFAEKNNGKWIRGGNWRNQNWPGQELPDKSWLDDITGDTPVFIERMDYHIGLANSAALKHAGITAATESPEGGVIVKDDNGEPNGLLKDKAMQLVYKTIPLPSEEELEEAALAALDHARKLGLTSIQDISYDGHFGIFQNLEKKGKLTCRVYSRPLLDHCYEFTGAEIKHRFGSDLLRTGSLKAFSDGSLGSHTAWFFEPYSDDSGNCGLPTDVVTNGNLEKWALEADKHKLQVIVHAIGDKANSEMINLCEKMREQNPDWDRRFRLEHGQHLRKEDIPRIRDNKIIISAQPYHFYDDGSWMEKAIGEERLRYSSPFRTLIDEGITVCFGSDWSVVTLDPIQGIYAAVTRHTADGAHPNGLIPEEKITVEEAVRGYTINAAYASFEENIKGSIEPGKLADMVILSEDIFTIPPEKIKDVKVEQTIFNGEKIY